jgi:hypothetical protein
VKQSRQVPAKIYRVKPVFDYLIRRFTVSYVQKVQLSVDERLLLWKVCFDSKFYIPKERSYFHVVSLKMCEAKTGYVWNI